MSGHSEDPVRRGFRFPAGVAATFTDAAQTFPCEAVNVSRSGVLLVGTFPTPTSEQLDLTLRTPNGQLSIDLAGKIIRVGSDPASNETQLAIEFVGIDPPKHDALDVFLARLIESQQPGPLENLRPGASPPEVKKALESIPLPQRMSLAQRADLKQRELLRQDQHPAVLESLVKNPNLTLPEARGVATNLGLPASAITLLANDLRFKNDEELRMALATHPKVPPATAEQLTMEFKPPQIRKLLARPGVNPLLRDKLFRKLTRG